MAKDKQLVTGSNTDLVSIEKLKTLKELVAKGATDSELELFAMYCNRSGLDPFANQIHFVVRGSGDKRKANFQTSIDGYRSLADRTEAYAGNDDYKFDEGLNEYEHIQTKRGNPKTATATIYKIVGGQKVAFTATARWEEYYPGDAMGFMWKKMPYLMLGKCAEALALRKGFPKQLAGIYTEEEMQQADVKPERVQAEVVEPVKAFKQSDEIVVEETKALDIDPDHIEYIKQSTTVDELKARAKELGETYGEQTLKDDENFMTLFQTELTRIKRALEKKQADILGAEK